MKQASLVNVNEVKASILRLETLWEYYKDGSLSDYKANFQNFINLENKLNELVLWAKEKDETET